MASLPPRPADDDGFQTFVMIVSGTATGAVITGLIDAVRAVSPFIVELIR